MGNASATSGLLDVDEAAAWLGVSPHTVRKWVQNDTIPHTRLGKLIRFTPEQLATFVADGAQ